MSTLSTDVAAMASAARAAAAAFTRMFEQTARALLQLLEFAFQSQRSEILGRAAEAAGVTAADVRRFTRTANGWSVTTWNRRTIDLTPYLEN